MAVAIGYALKTRPLVLFSLAAVGWAANAEGGAGGPLAVIDCFGILSDEKIRRFFELGCEVKALGRGHIQRIKEEVRKTMGQTSKKAKKAR